MIFRNKLEVIKHKIITALSLSLLFLLSACGSPPDGQQCLGFNPSQDANGIILFVNGDGVYDSTVYQKFLPSGSWTNNRTTPGTWLNTKMQVQKGENFRIQVSGVVSVCGLQPKDRIFKFIASGKPGGGSINDILPSAGDISQITSAAGMVVLPRDRILIENATINDYISDVTNGITLYDFFNQYSDPAIRNQAITNLKNNLNSLSYVNNFLQQPNLSNYCVNTGGNYDANCIATNGQGVQITLGGSYGNIIFDGNSQIPYIYEDPVNLKNPISRVVTFLIPGNNSGDSGFLQNYVNFQDIASSVSNANCVDKNCGFYIYKITHTGCDVFNSLPLDYRYGLYDAPNSGRLEYYISDNTPPAATDDNSNVANSDYQAYAYDSGTVWVRVKSVGISRNNFIAKGSYEVKVSKDVQKNAVSSLETALNSLISRINRDLKNASMAIFTLFTQSAIFGISVFYILNLYIIIFGIAFILGLVQVTKQDLVVRIIKIGIINALFTNTSWAFFNEHLFNAIIGGRDYILSVATGMNYSTAELPQTSGPFSFISNNFAVFFNGTIWAKLFGMLLTGPVGAIYFIAIVFSYIAFAFAIVKILVYYIISIISLYLLFAIFPFMALFMLFQRTQEQFNNWIKQALGYALRPVLIIVAITIVNQMVVIFFMQSFAFDACWNCAIPFYLGDLYLGCLNWYLPVGDLGTFLGGIIMPILMYLILTMLFLHMPDFIAGTMVRFLLGTPFDKTGGDAGVMDAFKYGASKFFGVDFGYINSKNERSEKYAQKESRKRGIAGAMEELRSERKSLGEADKKLDSQISKYGRGAGTIADNVRSQQEFKSKTSSSTDLAKQADALSKNNGSAKLESIKDMLKTNQDLLSKQQSISIPDSSNLSDTEKTGLRTKIDDVAKDIERYEKKIEGEKRELLSREQELKIAADRANKQAIDISKEKLSFEEFAKQQQAELDKLKAEITSKEEKFKAKRESLDKKAQELLDKYAKLEGEKESLAKMQESREKQDKEYKYKLEQEELKKEQERFKQQQDSFNRDNNNLKDASNSLRAKQEKLEREAKEFEERMQKAEEIKRMIETNKKVVNDASETLEQAELAVKNRRDDINTKLDRLNKL